MPLEYIIVDIVSLYPTRTAKDVYSPSAIRTPCDILARLPLVNFHFVLAESASDVVNRVAPRSRSPARFDAPAIRATRGEPQQATSQ